METINGDLFIKGDLICGDDGILDATGDVTWGFSLAPEGVKYNEMFKDVPEGDFILAGRQVLVKGNCYVFGNIVYDQHYYKGYIRAGCDMDMVDKTLANLEAAEKTEIIFSTDGDLPIYSFVGAPRWWATIREAEEALSVFKAGMLAERERLMKDAIECNVIWYDGRLLDFTQEQLDAALDKIGAGVDAKVSVIIIKKKK